LRQRCLFFLNRPPWNPTPRTQCRWDACAIPLAIMIGSSKAPLRKQAQAPEHVAVME
jgi:hypothetical protein